MLNSYAKTGIVSAPESPVSVSIGLLARNEAEGIRETLDSLFEQTILNEANRRKCLLEIICIVNGSEDATASLVSEYFKQNPLRTGCTARVINLFEAGKINAWNQFVHRYSTESAKYLILMDADIVFGHPATLWNLCSELETQPNAEVATGEPVKDLSLKPSPSLRERLSLSTSRMTQKSGAQMTGQLYCIRSETARRIHLPRQLAACEDGLIKCLVCTDFGNVTPQPERIVKTDQASHVFKAYVTLNEILQNQRRQMIGQTYIHVLVDQFIPSLTSYQRSDLKTVLTQLDEDEPDWLRKLIKAHLARTRYFWRMFPGLTTFRMRRLNALKKRDHLRHMPAAMVGSLFSLVAAWMAASSLRKGETDIWPSKVPTNLKSGN